MTENVQEFVIVSAGRGADRKPATEGAAPSDAPDSEMRFVPCVAVIVPAPQLPVKPFGVAINSPAGSVSPKPMPLNPAAALGLVRVKLRVVVPFNGIDAAPKALLMVGGANTVRLAVDVLLLPPSFDDTWTELLFCPEVVPVTFTEMLHEEFAAAVAPESEIEDDPATAVRVGPHPLRVPGGVATTNPLGRVSVNERPVNATFEFVF